MADFPLGSGTNFISIGEDNSLSIGTVVVSGLANTKGAWVELTAATTDEIISVTTVINSVLTATNGNDIIVDVGIGGAGSEEVIIENINITYGNNAFFEGAYFQMPISIPLGSRVSVRAQSSVSSDSCSVMLLAGIGSFTSNTPLSRATSLGVDLATTRGAVFDPGAVANTKGAWSEVVTSTVEGYRGFSLILSSNQNTAQTDQTGLMDIGIGTAGFEEVIASNVPYKISAAEFANISSSFMSIAIPSGVRLSVRAQSSTINITDRVNGIYIYGVN